MPAIFLKQLAYDWENSLKTKCEFEKEIIVSKEEVIEAIFYGLVTFSPFVIVPWYAETLEPPIPAQMSMLMIINMHACMLIRPPLNYFGLFGAGKKLANSVCQFLEKDDEEDIHPAIIFS